jgi:hypothetical protein
MMGAADELFKLAEESCWLDVQGRESDSEFKCANTVTARPSNGQCIASAATAWAALGMGERRYRMRAHSQLHLESSLLAVWPGGLQCRCIGSESAPIRVSDDSSQIRNESAPISH